MSEIDLDALLDEAANTPKSQMLLPPATVTALIERVRELLESTRDNEANWMAELEKAKAAEARVAELEAELARADEAWKNYVADRVAADEGEIEKLRKAAKRHRSTPLASGEGNVRILQVRVTEKWFHRLERWRLKRDLSVSAAARQLIEAGLNAEAERDDLRAAITALANEIDGLAETRLAMGDTSVGVNDLRGCAGLVRALLNPPTTEHVHQWRTYRPYKQPAYQSCVGCGNVVPAPKDNPPTTDPHTSWAKLSSGEIENLPCSCAVGHEHHRSEGPNLLAPPPTIEGGQG